MFITRLGLDYIKHASSVPVCIKTTQQQIIKMTDLIRDSLDTEPWGHRGSVANVNDQTEMSRAHALLKHILQEPYLKDGDWAAPLHHD